jgi:hypothetical protein
VNRGVSWLLIAPLLVIGLLAGHAAGYRWTFPDEHQRAHALAESGHAYSSYVPILVAVALTLVAAAMVSRIRLALGGNHRATTPPWLLAALPPLAFLFQEYLERWLNGGHLEFATLWEPPVLIGLQLQIPFAIVALSLARILARAADAIGRALAPEPRQIPLESTPAWPAAEPRLAATRIAGRGWTDRGPPLLLHP